MLPYIIMFSHFVISSLVIFFVYRELAKLDKLKLTSVQSLVATLALTIPTFLVSLVAPGIGGVIIGAALLFAIQRSYIKDNKKNALLTLKVAAILILIIILILVASGFILR